MSNAYRAPETEYDAIGKRPKYPILMAASSIFAFTLMAYFFEDVLFNENSELSVRFIAYASFFVPLILIHQLLSLTISLWAKIFLRHEFVEYFSRYQKYGYTIVTLGILGTLFFGIGRRALLF
ncbi:MAG: hypothetical protein COA42_23205 [Alteromonadaceae bacterium]|nr:MAG: hypothetical protein COA42_23205 [Alteromonadaceae bacterium]